VSWSSRRPQRRAAPPPRRPRPTKAARVSRGVWRELTPLSPDASPGCHWTARASLRSPHHKVHHGGLRGHVIHLQLAMQRLRMRVVNWTHGSVVSRAMAPWLPRRTTRGERCGTAAALAVSRLSGTGASVQPGGEMPKVTRRKHAAFSVRTCPHCGKKTRGPAHFRHEQACRRAGRGRRMAAPGRGRRTLSGRGRIRRGFRPMGRFFEQLRRLVRQEIQRQLGFPA
jgi:hypothetical protein